MEACVEYVLFHKRSGSLIVAINLPTKYLPAPPRAGFFIVCLQEEWTHKQGFAWVLTHSPEAHQNLMGSTPELCSGVHQ